MVKGSCLVGCWCALVEKIYGLLGVVGRKETAMGGLISLRKRTRVAWVGGGKNR